MDIENVASNVATYYTCLYILQHAFGPKLKLFIVHSFELVFLENCNLTFTLLYPMKESVSLLYVSERCIASQLKKKIGRKNNMENI